MPCTLQVIVNEEEDPYLAMQRLRQQVADLQAELRHALLQAELSAFTTTSSACAASQLPCKDEPMHGHLSLVSVSAAAHHHQASPAKQALLLPDLLLP